MACVADEGFWIYWIIASCFVTETVDAREGAPANLSLEDNVIPILW